MHTLGTIILAFVVVVAIVVFKTDELDVFEKW